MVAASERLVGLPTVGDVEEPELGAAPGRTGALAASKAGVGRGS